MYPNLSIVSMVFVLFGLISVTTTMEEKQIIPSMKTGRVLIPSPNADVDGMLIPQEALDYLPKDKLDQLKSIMKSENDSLITKAMHIQSLALYIKDLYPYETRVGICKEIISTFIEEYATDDGKHSDIIAFLKGARGMLDRSLEKGKPHIPSLEGYMKAIGNQMSSSYYVVFNEDNKSPFHIYMKPNNQNLRISEDKINSAMAYCFDLCGDLFFKVAQSINKAVTFKKNSRNNMSKNSYKVSSDNYHKYFLLKNIFENLSIKPNIIEFTGTFKLDPSDIIVSEKIIPNIDIPSKKMSSEKVMSNRPLPAKEGEGSATKRDLKKVVAITKDDVIVFINEVISKNGTLISDNNFLHTKHGTGMTKASIDEYKREMPVIIYDKMLGLLGYEPFEDFDINALLIYACDNYISASQTFHWAHECMSRIKQNYPLFEQMTPFSLRNLYNAKMDVSFKEGMKILLTDKPVHGEALIKMMLMNFSRLQIPEKNHIQEEKK